MKKTDDILALGLILMAIFFLIFVISSNFILIIKLIGVIGSVFVIIAESVYLLQKLFK